MKHTYLVEVEVNNMELADVNSSRLKLKQQLHTKDDVVENIICDALSGKLFKPGATCRPLKLNKLTSGKDPDANL